MARSKRNGRGSRRTRATRYADGSAIPANLLGLVPRQAPVSYVGDREHIRSLALLAFTELPTLAHAVLVTDVLGGVHGVRCFEEERGLHLCDVGVSMIGEVARLRFAVHLLYLSSATRAPAATPHEWDAMKLLHAEPPYLADALTVHVEHGQVLSLADRFAGERAHPQDN